ncbi:MAG: formyltetrahydrofolate deformylase [Phycisphaerales bacterium]|nr:formyltetrahydrofolate deformylase [Phycisphaerales bacterium]
MTTARVLIHCPDRTGVIARVSSFLAERGLNILDADQHTDPDTGRFFMRVEFDAGTDAMPGGDARVSVERDFDHHVGGPLAMDASFRWPGRTKRIAVLAGPSLHCAADLLWRVSTGEMRCEVTRVISNHEAAGDLASRFGLPFDHLPVTPGMKAEQEQRVAALLDGDQADGGLDLIVLARYMQILSDGFVSVHPARIINIHHSFLPAFAGAKPYHQAFERGVKLIGATSHYATAELDDGPIIAQQTAHVSHRDTVDDLVRKGRDLERTVHAEAVRLHLDDRVLVEGRKTVVFD